MKRLSDKIRRFSRDQAGGATVEWTLLLIAFGLPMVLLARLLLATLIGHYQLATCLITLPFP